jgi:hypothetical protein
MVDVVTAADVVVTVQEIARKAIGLLSEKRMKTLFSSAHRTLCVDTKIDDASAWKIINTAIDADDAEKISHFAHKAILAECTLAVSLMGILLGKELDADGFFQSNYQDMLRVLRDMNDEELIFLGMVVKIGNELISTQSEPKEPRDDPWLVHSSSTIGEKIGWTERYESLMYRLRGMHLGDHDAADALRLNQLGLDIGHLYLAFSK